MAGLVSHRTAIPEVSARVNADLLQYLLPSAPLVLVGVAALIVRRLTGHPPKK